MNGFIKLHRKMTDWEWYTDVNVKCLFIHLLLTVNNRENRWRGQVVRRGERITSIASLAAETGMSVMQIRAALKKLKKTGDISIKTTAKNTIIMVENYDMYQSNEQTNLMQDNAQDNDRDNEVATRSQQGRNKVVTTNKKEKKGKKDKKEEKKENIGVSGSSPKSKEVDPFEEYSAGDDELLAALRGYEQMRKQIKKPLTDQAKALALRKLDSLAMDRYTKIEIVNQSILNSWQGLFPLKKPADIPKLSNRAF